MACINPDGTLTKPAQTILKAMKAPARAEELAGASGFPLYRVRSVIRELLDAGLAVEKDEKFTISELGLEKVTS